GRKLGGDPPPALHDVQGSLRQAGSVQPDRRGGRAREPAAARGRPPARVRSLRQGAGRGRRGADADAEGAPLDDPDEVQGHDRRAVRAGRGGRRREPPVSPPLVFLLQLLIAGIAVGGVYALMALGFVLIFKASSVVNFGPGELVLFGAYVSWATILHMKFPLWIAFPVTLVVSILLGLVIERGILRPLIGQPIISVIMVTFGFASVIRGFLNMTWGSDTRPFPALFSSEPFRFGPIPISPVHLWSFVAVLVLLAGFSLFFKFSLVGMAMRATADNQQVAQSLGISVKWIFALSWCIATVVSALGGIILGSVRGGVDFSLADYGLKVFPVVILGGLDSVAGVIVSGVIIGVLENLSGGYLDPIFGGGVKEVAPFVVLVLILMVRPYGLFGKRDVERV